MKLDHLEEEGGIKNNMNTQSIDNKKKEQNVTGN